MTLGFDNWLMNEQAKHEHWHDQPRCEICGCAILDVGYHTPDGLLCEACTDELLESYKLDWTVDVDDWRAINE